MSPELRQELQKIIDNMNGEIQDYKNGIQGNPFLSHSQWKCRIDCVLDYIDDLEELMNSKW